MTDPRNRITHDPAIMLGKPIVKGTRITVEMVLRKMSEGANANDMLQMYPALQLGDVYACLLYAAETIAHEEVIIPKANLAA